MEKEERRVLSMGGQLQLSTEAGTSLNHRSDEASNATAKTRLRFSGLRSFLTSGFAWQPIRSGRRGDADTCGLCAQLIKDLSEAVILRGSNVNWDST